MFKRHQFTCPDVIYLRNQQKKNSLIAIGVYAAFFGGLAWVGHRAEQKTPDLAIVETPAE